MFIARISRGRTVREFIIGVLFVPTLLTSVWLTLFGGTALNIELVGGGGIVAATLLTLGGLVALQTASITAALRFSIIMLFMRYCLVKALREDAGVARLPVPEAGE